MPLCLALSRWRGACANSFVSKSTGSVDGFGHELLAKPGHAHSVTVFLWRSSSFEFNLSNPDPRPTLQCTWKLRKQFNGGVPLVRMAFGSNGIYVGGKDTFISELSGNWAVHGELAAMSVTGAPGRIGRITVELGSAPPQTLARCGRIPAHLPSEDITCFLGIYCYHTPDQKPCIGRTVCKMADTFRPSTQQPLTRCVI